MAKYAEKVVELLQDLRHTEWIPPYKQQVVESVLSEMDSILNQIIKNANNEEWDVENDPKAKANVLFYNQCYLRDRRCMLAYLYERLQRLKQLDWEIGASNVPPHIKDNITSAENTFTQEYDNLISEYNEALNINVRSLKHPPKTILVEVEVLKSEEKVIGAGGYTINLQKNARLNMSLADAEPLIEKGIVKQIQS